MRYKKLSDWLQWQEKLHPVRVDLGLDRVRKVAENCQLLPVKPAVITVAGTNGKGSTVALLASILSCQGYRVACYTSPHLHRYNERICVRGIPIEENELCLAFDFIDRGRDGISLSFFEFGTLAALYYFSRHPLDIILLEVGLGGRLDAVNIVEPNVSVITSIGIDHTEWLGDDRESIAREKAGIMRYNKPVVCGDTNPPKTVSMAAAGKGAQLYQLNTDFFYTHHAGNYSFRTVEDDFILDDLPEPALFGGAQLQNAATALMTLHCLQDQFPISREAVIQGFESVQLQGRFQIKTGNKTRIFDIAHNPHGTKVLADNLRQLPCSGKTHAVFAVLAGKDVNGMLQEMIPLIDCWYLTQLDTERALSLDILEEKICAYNSDVSFQKHNTVHSACHAALSQMAEDDRLIVFGSIITVAEALSADI